MRSIRDTNKNLSLTRETNIGSIKACKQCSGLDCCGILREGGIIEPPYLTKRDIEQIEYFSGIGREQFSLEKENPVTGNKIRIMRTTVKEGCTFFNNKTGRCDIYSFRPMDCRLFPLDIRFIENKYYWALFKYERCNGSIEQDLDQLFRYKDEALDLLNGEILDYATFPVPGMDRIGYKILTELKL